MGFAGLIFDVDGTMAETEEAHRAAFNATFAAHGLDWDWDVPLYRRLLRVAGGKERIRHFLETCRPESLEAFPPERVAALHAAKTGRYVALVAAGQAPLRPGVARLIGEARAAGLRLGIATTTSRPNIEQLLESTLGAAAIGWFDAIATGEDAAVKKPDPGVYKVALARMGLTGAECLAIEDSRMGVAAALGAGVPVIVTRSAYCLDQDYDGALVVLDDLAAVALDHLRAWHAAAAVPA